MPVANDDIRLRDLIDQPAAGDPVQLTRDGRDASVIRGRNTFDELLLAAGQDARRELRDGS